MTKTKTIKCGCQHDNTFWVKYCPEHELEAKKAQGIWARHIARLKRSKHLDRLANLKAP